MEKYETEKILARGTFGTVYLAHLKNDTRKRPVVIKQLSMEVFSNNDRISTFNETKVLKMLNHPNIIQYYDSFLSHTDATSMYIVMEYAPGGTLHDLIELRRKSLSKKMESSESFSGYFQENEIGHLFSQIVLSLHLVHSHNVVHRDLKSQNVFLTRNLDHIKLGDFGISKILASKSQAHSVVGTPCYISPELCEGKPYNQKSDIWSIGCILYELCCLKRAFDAPNLPALILKISKGKVEGQIPSQYSQTLVKLIDWMLATYPDERPDITQVMAHHWVAPHVYKLPTSLGVLPYNSYKNESMSDKKEAQTWTSDYGVNTRLLSIEQPRQDRTSTQTKLRGISKCVVKKLSLSEDRILPMPEFEVNTKIMQICGKNMALTDSGNVIKWRTSTCKKSSGDDPPKIDCLLYDSYFKDKGVKISYLATSRYFDCFITNRGILMTKGNGRYGCLGHGDRKSVIQPKIVEFFLADEMQIIKCSDHHVVACTIKNDVFCWGQNVSNCFGFKYLEDINEPNIFCLPIKVSFPRENQKSSKVILDIFCTQGKTCILMDDRRTIYYAGSFLFSGEPSTSSDGFHKFVEPNESRRIKDIGLIPTKTVILYEDGSIKVSTTGTYQYSVDLHLSFKKNLLGNQNCCLQEKATKLLIVKAESWESCDYDEESCLVICTNLNNNIFVCHHFHCFLLSMKDHLVVRPETENPKHDVIRIDMNDNDVQKLFRRIPIGKLNDTSFSKHPGLLFESNNWKISQLNFYHGDAKEKHLLVALTSNSK